MSSEVDGQPILETEGLDAGYLEVNILHGVSVHVPRGAIVSIIGPNGAGKSTLLKAIYGYLKPRAGRVVFRRDAAEHEITGLKPNQITRLGLSYIPQLDNVFPSMSVLENLEMGAFARNTSASEQMDRIFDWFPRLAERRRQRAGTMSGGERQMLALGRALMNDPQVLLLDEPSAGLAPTVVDEIFAKLQEINREEGISMIMVEQNARRSLAMSDYGYVLDMGKNRFEGKGDDLLHDPKVTELYLGGRGRLAAAEQLGDEDYEAAPELRDPRRDARRDA
jgi:neutral amino acid transport system ATP-binding protein